MRRLLLLLSLTLPLSLSATANTAGADGSAAQRLVELSQRREVVATDPLVAQAGGLLKKAARSSGADEQAVAEASIRAARFLFDATKAPVTPLDVVDAIAARGKGRVLSDTIGAYVEARRNSAGKTHAEALAAMK